MREEDVEEVMGEAEVKSGWIGTREMERREVSMMNGTR